MPLSQRAKCTKSSCRWLKFQVQVEIGIEKYGMVMPLDGSNNKVTVQWK